MKKAIDFIIRLLNTAIICFCANSFLFLRNHSSWKWIAATVIVFLLANLMPLISTQKLSSFRLRVCRHGAECLKIFLFSTCASIIYHIIIAFKLFPEDWKIWLISAGICILGEAILFWNGIICVYLSSVQLGIKHRVIGIICGMIPIVHLIVLFRIIKTVSDEVEFERSRDKINDKRKAQQVCKTKYPILLVHGVFFRDYKHISYWGRIPEELRKNGAQVFYGNQHSAASVKDSAEELTERIKQILDETGCDKINVIAHSKGGLDIRYAMSYCGVAPHIASVATINTPHRGCEFADYLLTAISEDVQNKVANVYNNAMRKLGDKNPDFMSAVQDLTYSACKDRDKEMQIPKGVYCQSVGSKLNRATSGKFPTNLTYHLVKHFDGPNDGLVAETSFSWGEKYTFLTAKGKRGISHGDMIDMNRENLYGFDVREFYVQLVAELKEKGL